MQDYNFDEITNRRNTNSYKWNTPPRGVIPMWVADMDFKTDPCIIEALKHRVDHGIFGYTKVPDEYYAAIYGSGGDDFIRINLACPRSLLEEGLQRIVGVLSRFSK